MEIELTQQDRAQAIASVECYFNEQFADESGTRLGNMQAGALLNFFLEEIGPCVYNQAVAEVQVQLALRVSEVDIECHAEAFGYWQKRASTASAKTNPDSPAETKTLDNP